MLFVPALTEMDGRTVTVVCADDCVPFASVTVTVKVVVVLGFTLVDAAVGLVMQLVQVGFLRRQHEPGQVAAAPGRAHLEQRSQLGVGADGDGHGAVDLGGNDREGQRGGAVRLQHVPPAVGERVR